MTVFVSRLGKTTPADEAFHAWTSGNLDRMVAALNVKTNPIDRHFLLMGIVEATYKKRNDHGYRRTCLDVARLHIQEFPGIAPALRREMGGELPRVSTFARLATVLTEDECFDDAINVCELAIAHGLHDGTTGGYAGRINRIQRKEAAARPRNA